jgi:DNA-binding transcriptional MocR family regulator
VPGAFCHQPDENGFIPSNHLRRCFGNVLPEQVEPGIQQLAEVVKRQLRPARTEHGLKTRATV